MMFPRQKEVPSACAGSYGVGAGEVRVTLKMDNSVAREILDALLRTSQFVMWVVVFRGEQPDAEFLKTQSLGEIQQVWTNHTGISWHATPTRSRASIAETGN